MHKSNDQREESSKKKVQSTIDFRWERTFGRSIRNKVNDDNTQNLCYYLSFYRFRHNMLSSVVEKTDGLPALHSAALLQLHKNDTVFFLFSFSHCCCVIHCAIIRNVFLLWHFSTLLLHFVFDGFVRFAWNTRRIFHWNCRFRVTCHTVSQSIWIIRMRAQSRIISLVKCNKRVEQ